MRLYSLVSLVAWVGFSTALCPHPGWTEFNGICYLVTESMVPWGSVANICKQEDPDATAVSIHSALDNTFISQLLLSNSPTHSQAWLGFGRHRNDCAESCEDLVFEWLDATDVDFLYWDTGEPSSSNKNNCALANFNKVTGQWGLADCQEKYPALCQVPARDPCLTGWKLHDGLCFWFSGSTLSTGHDLKSSCEAFNSSVPAASHSKEMDQFLKALALPTSSKTWFGLYRNGKDLDEWSWYDGSAVNYLGWEISPAPGWDCGMVQDLGNGVTWIGGICSNQAPFFCQLNPDY